MGPPLFFHLDINPVLCHVMVYSVDKLHVLVVTVELIQLLLLNILSFNFIQTPSKSLRFKRFRRSYVNRPVFVSTNHCQSFNAFLLDVRCSKQRHSFFCSCLSQMKEHMHNLFFSNTLVAQILLTQKDVKSRRAGVKQLFINI